MRHLLLGLTLLVTAGDRTTNRDALLAADRALSDKTASLGMVQGFVPVLDHGAAYLYPGAPLLRGSDRIRSFLERSARQIPRVLAEDTRWVAARGVCEFAPRPRARLGCPSALPAGQRRAQRPGARPCRFA